MKRHPQSLLRLFGLFIVLIGCNNSNDNSVPGHWYKGNLHTHSYWSDGDEFPEQIMDWYKSRGYHFLALSDHNRLAEGEYWIEIPEGEMYQDAFADYLSRYGEDWVVYRQDSGKTEVQLKTYEEYRPLFEEKERFLVLPSEEITDQYEGAPLHLNATNIQSLIAPQGGNSVVEVLQNNIDAVQQQRMESGSPMIVHINHPNFHFAIGLEDMMALQGERFFEVFNGHPQVHNFGDSTHLGTEEMWDLINIAYLEAGKPLIYSLATDDSHHYHQFDSRWSNSGRGWVMVQADSLETHALIASLEQGRFYASTGPSLSDVSFRENQLSVSVEAEPNIHYEILFIGCKKGEQQSRVLQKTEANSATYTLEEDLLFVRAKIISDKQPSNPIENVDYEMAWTQPVQPQ